MSKFETDRPDEMVQFFNDPSPCIVVLCGLPASGKSTFASLFDGKFTIISTDRIIDGWAESAGVTYDAVWESSIKDATKLANIQFNGALAQNHSIVWDQTNLSVKKRRSILSRVPDNYRKVAIFVQCPEDVRQKRLASRPGKTIPEDVDAQMRNRLAEPVLDEGFDKVFTVHSVVAE